MFSEKKIGILGGGQLGKMLCEAGMAWHLPVSVLDRDISMPAAPYSTRFVPGNFKNYEDVYTFGKTVDILTIEIEHVNLNALFDLEKEGIKIYPKPDALVHIIDKGLQKKFFSDNHIPTASFELFDSKLDILEALYEKRLSFPFIQKARTEGYDGRGVSVIRDETDLEKVMNVPSVTETMVDIDKEISVITARNPSGQIATYDPVEMVFRDQANLLDMLISPARLDERQRTLFMELAERIIQKMDIVGLLAVEFFLDRDGQIFVNEMAPRPHNSGHQTIENNLVSQYQQHLRAILDWPLATPKQLSPAVMINLLGESGASGIPFIENLERALKTEGLFLHWYGKTRVEPFRKMGHMTLLSDSVEKAISMGSTLRELVKITAKTT